MQNLLIFIIECDIISSENMIFQIQQYRKLYIILNYVFIHSNQCKGMLNPIHLLRIP